MNRFALLGFVTASTLAAIALPLASFAPTTDVSTVEHLRSQMLQPPGGRVKRA